MREMTSAEGCVWNELASGPRTALDISNDSGVCRSRVHTILNRFEDEGLVILIEARSRRNRSGIYARRDMCPDAVPADLKGYSRTSDLILDLLLTDGGLTARDLADILQWRYSDMHSARRSIKYTLERLMREGKVEKSSDKPPVWRLVR